MVHMLESKILPSQEFDVFEIQEKAQTYLVDLNGLGCPI
jgi:hypothetical protein